MARHAPLRLKPQSSRLAAIHILVELSSFPGRHRHCSEERVSGPHRSAAGAGRRAGPGWMRQAAARRRTALRRLASAAPARPAAAAAPARPPPAAPACPLHNAPAQDRVRRRTFMHQLTVRITICSAKIACCSGSQCEGASCCASIDPPSRTPYSTQRKRRDKFRRNIVTKHIDLQ